MGYGGVIVAELKCWRGGGDLSKGKFVLNFTLHFPKAIITIIINPQDQPHRISEKQPTVHWYSGYESKKKHLFSYLPTIKVCFLKQLFIIKRLLALLKYSFTKTKLNCY